ncbi:hypothetical protein GCM10022217_24280 [Chryseobacterium ginsenosidimutans]|uniref:hypothetical protein n=1 Tax=Chryseobacterium ginsenosidimutans TaxID=687846 RepID=UPI0031D2835A
MKTQMNEKGKERSSLAKRGRFFLFVISVVLFFQPLHAMVPDHPGNEKIAESDSLKSFDDNIAKIYVTGDAQISDIENVITSPVIIVKNSEHKQVLKKEKLKNKVVAEKNAKKNTQSQTSTSKFYYTNPQDKKFNYFVVGSDRAVVTTTQQIKLFSINKFLILSLVFLWSLYLIPFFKENIFFIQFSGKNFQRPPPYFSAQLF